MRLAEWWPYACCRWPVDTAGDLYAQSEDALADDDSPWKRSQSYEPTSHHLPHRNPSQTRTSRSFARPSHRNPHLTHRGSCAAFRSQIRSQQQPPGAVFNRADNEPRRPLGSLSSAHRRRQTWKRTASLATSVPRTRTPPGGRLRVRRSTRRAGWVAGWNSCATSCRRPAPEGEPRRRRGLWIRRGARFRRLLNNKPDIPCLSELGPPAKRME